MKEGNKYDGFCIDVLKELKKMMNFEYTIKEVSDFSPTAKNDWKSVIRQLIVGVCTMYRLSLVFLYNIEIDLTWQCIG